MKLKRYNSEVYQVVENEKVVFLITKYTNEKWGISDCNDKKVKGAIFSKPKEAFEFLNK